MTASRTCRSCGAGLPPDIPWCLRCYAPVRQLTPRESQLSSPFVAEPRPEPPTSRWRRGPTTFGPVGRLTITAIVLAAGPWRSLTGFGDPMIGLALWYLFGYTLIAVFVLRGVWRRERVLEPGPASRSAAFRERVARRLPRLGRSIEIPPLVVVGALALVVAIAIGVIWASSDAAGRYYLVAVGTVIGAGTFLIVWNEL